MDESYMILEEKLNTRFDNPVSIDTNSGRPTGKDIHRQRDGSDRGMQGRYEKYIHMTFSREKIH